MILSYKYILLDPIGTTKFHNSAEGDWMAIELERVEKISSRHKNDNLIIALYYIHAQDIILHERKKFQNSIFSKIIYILYMSTYQDE